MPDAERALMSTMTAQISALVGVESPSEDLAAVRRCATTIVGLCDEVVGETAEIVETDGRPHVLVGGRRPRVLLLGHLDTVWPLGTLESVPCVVRDGQLRGPGSFDMKAGIVLALHALAGLEGRSGVSLLLTSDEEIGSHSSRELLLEMAAGAEAVLVLEPSGPGGALKTGRKGVASYRVELEGRASHAGLEPEKGINAVLESAHEIIDTVALDDPDAGTTVTPTIVRGGTAVNVIPELATIEIDVRAASRFELDRVDAALNARSPRSGARRRVERMSFRPPLEQEMSARLFEIAQAVARDGALPEVTGVVVGGGSDGNFTAAAGTPTLDGLGAVGDGAHAPHEAVDIGALPARLELLRGLIDALLATEA